MSIKPPFNRLKDRTLKISELNLQWIGILLLCLSTLSTSVIRRGMLGLDGALSTEEMERLLSSGAAPWAAQAIIFSLAASLALPLYARLLVEAAAHEEDRRKLLLELGCCALASEIPYDWAMSGKLVDAGVQNPAWGLLLAGIMLLFFQQRKSSSPGADLASKTIAVLAAAAWVVLLRVRMGLPLVLLCALFYLAREMKKEWVALAGGTALTLFYFPAPLGLLLACLYDGSVRARRWIFCTLYTAQLAVFGALSAFLASQ